VKRDPRGFIDGMRLRTMSPAIWAVAIAMAGRLHLRPGRLRDSWRQTCDRDRSGCDGIPAYDLYKDPPLGERGTEMKASPRRGRPVQWMGQEDAWRTCPAR